MLKLISISDFINEPKTGLLLDARSEGEFERGHIPGAISFPILNNEERKLVGTCYKQKGHKEAVLLGYELVGTKFKTYVEYAYANWEGQEINIHCWRGGLRSQIMSNLLSSAGFNVKLIKGGYKAYRQVVLDFLAKDFEFFVLGGLTGSGKTYVLDELENRGAQVLNIEKLANHKGSAFGSLGQHPQPSQEHFENLSFEILREFNFENPVWVEDESRLIGALQVPTQIYQGIRNSFVYFLGYSFEDRLEHILKEYGCFDKNLLIERTKQIKKRMGDLINRMAIEALENGDLRTWAEIVLIHYDKQYRYGFGLRKPGQSKDILLKSEELILELLSVKREA
ncbi:MAG: tRNA 2-selenouridine(34) synthase MnmH [Bacteroidetes bacterium B1(2017)]|nr:MAG: tRNA 2-selenouridine(34) synthase MnmH [Bacteroidetes bacterium B1(2017)]